MIIIKERVQKLISQAGVASRRKAEELIINKKVLINGQIATLGDKASFKDNILVDNVPLIKEEKVYYMINKPTKVICSLKDPQGRKIITDFIDDNRHIFPIGRLDYDTTGTLLLTNDGELSNRLTHPSYNIIKIYRARLLLPLSKKELDFLNSNKVYLDDKQSKQTITQVDKKSYVISISVGTYHHIKKLFELVDSEVITLTRISFAGLSHVNKLSNGQYIKLNNKEIKWLKKLTGL